MPYLNMSNPILSPYLAQKFCVIRRKESINTHGRSEVAQQTFRNVVGVVTNASPNDLDRLDDSQRMGRNLVVVCKFQLRGPSKDSSGNKYQPDLIEWEGNQFVVKTLEPYPQYGQGFVQAIVGSMDIIDQAT